MSAAWTRVAAVRGPGRTLGLAVATLFVMLANPPAASAHAVLESSSPASGSALAVGSPPRAVVLRFDEAVGAALGGVRVLSASGARVDLNRVSHPGGNESEVTAPLRGDLAEGSYLVLWRVVSDDSHPVSGSFTFSYGHQGQLTSVRRPREPATTGVAADAARFVEYGAVLVLIGAIGFALFCSSQAARTRRYRVLLLGSAAVSLAGTGAEFCLQAARDLGGGIGGAWNVTALRALLDTTYGHAHLTRALALVAVLVLFADRDRAPGRGSLRAPAAAMVVVAATIAMAGHSGVPPALILWLPLDVVHIVAAGAWLGGLVALLVTFARARPRVDRVPEPPSRVPVGVGATEFPLDPSSGGGAPPRSVAPDLPPTRPTLSGAGGSLDEQAFDDAVRRFSRLAAGCVLVLVLTGLAQAWRQVRGLTALLGTDYGHLLLLKLLFVAVMLCAAACSRSVVQRSRTSHVSNRLLRSVVLEVLSGVLVVAVTTVLVSAPPARTALSNPIDPGTAAIGPVDHTVTTGPVTVQVTTLDLGNRSIELRLLTFDKNRVLRDVSELSARADLPGRSGASTVNAPLRHVATGRYAVEGWWLPRAGDWRLTVSVRTSQVDAYVAATTITVR